MNDKSLKQKTLKGLIWSSIERFSVQGVQFVLGLILARLLLPEDYGLIAMLAIFLALSQTFIESGFNVALIQKKNRDELDYSTTFYFNIVVAFILYAVLYISAPYIADFYDQKILISLTRIIGITIIINSFAVVQRAKFTVNIDFKTQTKASLVSVTISGILGVYLAYTGHGVWSLVWQAILQRILDTLILWYYSKWLPKEGFSYERFKKLFAFGSKLLMAGLLNTLFKNIYLIIIGKMFSASSLGFFTRAKQLNDFPSSNVTTVLDRVMFPILSEMQDDKERLLATYRKTIVYAALLIFPLMMGLAALAEPLIRVVLTDKWIESVWMLQLLTFAGMWYPIHSLNLNVLNVMGRSDYMLRLEVIKKILISIVLVISVPLGIEAMIYGMIITSYISLIINTYYTKRIINYGFFKQMRDLIFVLLLSFAMGAVIYASITFISSDVLKLVFGLIEGTIFYIGIAWVFNIGKIRLLPAFVRQ